jgi:hypothetical protein
MHGTTTLKNSFEPKKLIKTFVPVCNSYTIYGRTKARQMFKGQRVVVFTQNKNHSRIYHVLIHRPSNLHTSVVGVTHSSSLVSPVMLYNKLQNVQLKIQMLFKMVLLVWHYTTTCAWASKTVAGEGRTCLGHPYQLNQSTVLVFEQRHFLRFIMRLTVKERVFILESYIKTISYVHCRQRFFEKFRRQAIHGT